MSPISFVTFLLPLLLLALPVYLTSKWLEKKINPRAGAKRFLLWLLLVVAMSFTYYFAIMLIYFKFIFPNHK